MKKLYELSDKLPEKTDYAYIVNAAGSQEWKVDLDTLTEISTTGPLTVNLNSSMTASEIQDEIDAIPKIIPPQNVVTIQFANGTYNLNSPIRIEGFLGVQININGDTSQGTILHTNQNVHLNFNNNTHGLFIEQNQGLSQIVVQNLKITTGDGYNGISLRHTCWARIRYCYLLATAKTSSATNGIWVNSGARANVYRTYFSNQHVAMLAQISGRISSEENDDTGTQPNYGLSSVRASSIGKRSTQPSGSTANENTGNGGVIR